MFYTSMRRTFIACAFTSLAGCSFFATYQEPVSGPIARIRLVGSQPKIYTGHCPADESRGVAEWGTKAHDLGMPKQSHVPADRLVTEYRVIADRPLTLTFADPEFAAPKGFRMVYGAGFCPYSTTAFIPKDGHDYVVRENGHGYCKASVSELVKTPEGLVRETAVETLPPCG
ncbi:hypothetical protein ACQVBX_13480 [Dyella sp. KULCS107]|uniref:hypothetical protein n=1 Tax=Dyella sp. KULCS107 TaxID=3422216 RepID=UPI003D701245